MLNDVIIYDDAERHLQAVQHAGLDPSQADVHTAFFLGWLIDRDFISAALREGHGDVLREYQTREKTALDIYRLLGQRLDSSMLSDEGNAFAQAYYSPSHDQYLRDYAELLVRDLPSDYHVQYTWDNYGVIQKRIDDRYSVWRASHMRV